MDRKLNIAIGKFGKSLNFSLSRNSIIGGDVTPITFYVALCNMNPNINFYIIGGSNFNTLTDIELKKLFPNNNVFNLYDYDNLKDPNAHINVILNKCIKNNIKIDAGLFFNGLVTGVSIPDKINKIKSEGLSVPYEMMYRYNSQMFHFLNETQIPYKVILEDPRLDLTLVRDLFNIEKPYISQYEYNIKRNNITSYENQERILHEVPSTYKHIDKLFTIGETFPDINALLNLTKKIPLSLFLNGKMNKSNQIGNRGMNRLKIVKEYLIDNNLNYDDIHVYGVWNNNVYEDYNNMFQNKMISESINILYDTKYTLLIPIKKHWPTSKFWKMIHFGIIPFFHKTYDTQKHIKVPEYLRVNSPLEFKQKMLELDNNKDKYNEILNSLLDMLDENFYNGKNFNNIIMKEIYEMLNLVWEDKDIINELKISEFYKNKDKIIFKKMF